MKLADLRPVVQPKPAQKIGCVACKGAYAAECNVPIGDGSAKMCWLCAHHVVDHDVPLHEAMEARCECKPEDIYPARYFQKVAAGLTPVVAVAEDADRRKAS